ncbi:MAG: polysaccharide deacetylase family protein [Bacteroidetes bacterium]|nr:polysaccharide deacetylase family protein [Bacteroidota bacterium]
MMPPKGIFTISLDFELFWGVRDNRSLDSYGENIRKVHEIVPRLLEMFDKYGVHCTWTTVGFLFLNNKEELLNNLPDIAPGYTNTNFDPYPYIHNNSLEPIYHFAPDLVKQIASYPGQEIGTHTYCHFYTLEEGVTPASFAEDIRMAVKVAREKGHEIHSIVFPRNQYNNAMLDVCYQHGIKTYRGVEQSVIYETRNRTDETLRRRMLRLMDAYINLTGHHTFKINGQKGTILDIPSSRFLRPYSQKLSFLEPFKLNRVIKGLMHASKRGEVFHIWWHPHNFGANTEDNFNGLEKILIKFKQLKDAGLMESLNMYEIYQLNN